MEPSNLLPILAILAAAIVLVLVLRRYMASRLRDRHDKREPQPSRARPADLMTAEEHEYLDSSHIISGPPAGRR